MPLHQNFDIIKLLLVEILQKRVGGFMIKKYLLLVHYSPFVYLEDHIILVNGVIFWRCHGEYYGCYADYGLLVSDLRDTF